MTTPYLLRFAAAIALLALLMGSAAGREVSNAVVTEGGKTVWLAGQVALRDEEGKSLAGDVQSQARAIFRTISILSIPGFSSRSFPSERSSFPRGTSRPARQLLYRILPPRACSWKYKASL